MKRKSKKPTVKLIPPDLLQCQAVITAAHGPFALGPEPAPKRCNNAPTVVATATAPNSDGQHGAMSLCADCQAVFTKQMGAGFATFKQVNK